MSKKRVLFLCTGNSARSQMGEAFLRKYGDAYFEVHSAGLAAHEIHPLTRTVLEEAGLDISRQYSKDVREYLGKALFNILITVCDRAEQDCPTMFLGINQKLYWPFEDPVAAEGKQEAQIDAFRRVRDQIETRILDWLAEQGKSPDGR
jgi:arsenate reductase